MRPIARWLAPDARGSVAAALLAVAAQAAVAQDGSVRRAAPPCVLDKCLNGAARPPARGPTPADPPVETDADTPDAPSAGGAFRNATPPGAFDFYVLALSWSPAFCETGGAAKARQQCEPGGRLGFVVHGLWPQNTRGYPSDCDGTTASPSRLALDSVRGVYPDEGLARHEWRKHGTCTGLSPTAYFAQVRSARAAITIPEAFQAPDDARNWAPMEIARAFTAANPRLRTDSMAVTCRGTMIEEVRICFSKDLRGFVSCPEVARASCRRPVEVPPVL